MNRLFRMVNDVLAFALELSALVALGYWGFQVGQVLWTRILLSLGCVAAAAAVWGTFAAPRAIVKAPTIGVVAAKALVFAAATVALFDLKMTVLAAVFAVLVVLNTTAVTITRR